MHEKMPSPRRQIVLSQGLINLQTYIQINYCFCMCHMCYVMKEITRKKCIVIWEVKNKQIKQWMCSKLYEYMCTYTKAYINTSIYIYICEKRVGGTTARARTGDKAIKVFKWRFK